MAINREANRAWLLGYDPQEGWDVIEWWERENLDKDQFYERLDLWEAQTFAGLDEWQLG